jgi:hypothetical protein
MHRSQTDRLMSAMGLGRVRTLYGMERDDLGEVAM